MSIASIPSWLHLWPFILLQLWHTTMAWCIRTTILMVLNGRSILFDDNDNDNNNKVIMHSLLLIRKRQHQEHQHQNEPWTQSLYSKSRACRWKLSSPLQSQYSFTAHVPINLYGSYDMLQIPNNILQPPCWWGPLSFGHVGSLYCNLCTCTFQQQKQ